MKATKEASLKNYIKSSLNMNVIDRIYEKAEFLKAFNKYHEAHQNHIELIKLKSRIY